MRRKRPQYAAGIPANELVSILCRGRCGQPHSTLARLVKSKHAYPAQVDHFGRPERYAGYEAHCLKCGYVAHDNYNWHAGLRWNQ